MDLDPFYILIREDDDTRWNDTKIQWINANKNRINVGCCVSIDQHQTNPVTRVIEEVVNNYYRITRFKTKDSVYKLMEKRHVIIK